MTRKEKAAEFDQGYNVIVTGRHLQVTDAMKDHAIERISRLEKLGSRIIDVNVTMDIQKLEHRVDILMKYGHTIIRSHAASDDMYVSIDKAVEKLARQLTKYKERIQDHHGKGHPVVELPVKVVASLSDVHEINDQIEEENAKNRSISSATHRVVSHETKFMPVLTEDEAVMKMDLSQDTVMIFKSEENRQLKVIYRRKDGSYGIVTPQ